MAKKVVATLKDKTKKGLSRILIPMKSSKTGSYTFKKFMVPMDDVKNQVKSLTEKYDKFL